MTHQDFADIVANQQDDSTPALPKYTGVPRPFRVGPDESLHAMGYHLVAARERMKHLMRDQKKNREQIQRLQQHIVNLKGMCTQWQNVIRFNKIRKEVERMNKNEKDPFAVLKIATRVAQAEMQ